MIDLRETVDKFVKEPLKKLSFLRNYISVKTAAVLLIVLLASGALFAVLKIIPETVEKDPLSDSVKADDNDLVEIDIDISDFLIPEEIRSLGEFKWVPYRGVKEKWSDEDVKEFWISPEETVREIAEEKNEKSINELFESVP